MPKTHLGKRLDDGIKYMARLPIVVLFDGELPTRIVMRMRHHENLQFLRIPLVPFVIHYPTLFPRPTILIQELDLVVQILGGDVDRGPGTRDLRRNGLPGNRFSELGQARVGRFEGEGFGDPVSEGDEEEQEDGEGDAHCKEVGQEEVLEEGPFATLSGQLGF